jgi:hypothetical protein
VTIGIGSAFGDLYMFNLPELKLRTTPLMAPIFSANKPPLSVQQNNPYRSSKNSKRKACNRIDKDSESIDDRAAAWNIALHRHIGTIAVTANAIPHN